MIRHIIIITIFISFVLHSVTSDKTRDRVDVERTPRHRYKYNQPVDEIYASIPVAVVYEDKDIREEKSLKNDHTGTSKSEIRVKDPNLKHIGNTFMPFATNIKVEVDDTISKSKSNVHTKIIKEDQNTEITTMKDTDDIFVKFIENIKAHRVTKTDKDTSQSARDKLLKDDEITMNTTDKIDTTTENLEDHARLSPAIDTTSKFLFPYSKEIHIPVAVIYDTDSDPIRNNNDQIFATSPTQVPITFTPRTEKDKNNKQSLQQNGSILRASSFKDDKVVTTSSRKRQEKNEEVQFENKFQTTEQTVLAKMEKKFGTPQREHMSVIPQNEQKSVSSQKKSKSITAGGSVDSTNKNSTKSEKKRRERDPVVPIVESKNEIFSQTGEFRYR